MLNSRCVPSPRPGNGGIFPLRALLYLHHTDASACREMSCCTMFTLFHPTIKYAPCNTIHNMLYHTLPCNTRPLDMMRYESIPNHITHINTPRPQYCMAKRYDTTPQCKSTICAQRELRMGEYFCDSGNILCDTPCFTMYHTTPLPCHTMPNSSTPYDTTFPCQWQHFM